MIVIVQLYRHGLKRLGRDNLPLMVYANFLVLVVIAAYVIHVEIIRMLFRLSLQ